MDESPARPYHHGSLRKAVVEAAVAEVESAGTAHLSMREIARRARVSHAAPAHHFGDKAGIFTAVAAEGFRLLGDAFLRARELPNPFFQVGLAYFQFAVHHRGHFEVMFRPDLYRPTDPALIQARKDAFDVLYEVSRSELPRDEDDIAALAIASWSVTHGFATLWLHANLQDQLGDDVVAAFPRMLQGIADLGDVARSQLIAGQGLATPDEARPTAPPNTS
jgi:AcrR family transcriptional regulator